MQKNRQIQILDASEANPVELSALLNELEPEGGECQWTILDLEAVADPAIAGLDLQQLEDQIAQNINGVGFTWTELETLSAGTKDVWNGLIVGFKPPHLPNRNREESWRVCEFVIERFDSTSWTITAPESVRRRLRAAYGSAVEQAMSDEDTVENVDS